MIKIKNSQCHEPPTSVRQTDDAGVTGLLGDGFVVRPALDVVGDAFTLDRAVLPAGAARHRALKHNRSRSHCTACKRKGTSASSKI